MLFCIDTSHTGAWQRPLKLTGLGLVSEDGPGRREFYVELSDTRKVEDCYFRIS